MTNLDHTTGSAGEVVLTVSLTACSGKHVELARALADLTDVVRASPGCLRFDVWRDRADDHHFEIHEAWLNDDAFQRHVNSAPMRSFRDLDDLLVAERTWRSLEAVRASPAAVIRRFMRARHEGDRSAVAATIDEAFMLHVAGANSTSGDFRGREEAAGFGRRLDELVGSTWTVEAFEICDGPRTAVMLANVAGTREGVELRAQRAAVYLVRGERMVEEWFMDFDQAATDEFFGVSGTVASTRGQRWIGPPLIAAARPVPAPPAS